MPDSPPRLDFVFQKYDPPLYFITFNTYRRKRLISNDAVQARLIEFANAGIARGIAIGRYVIMPDHVHLFARGTYDYPLTQWMRLLKRSLSQVIPARLPHWQRGFFDHLIRHSESYSQKWELRPAESGSGGVSKASGRLAVSGGNRTGSDGLTSWIVAVPRLRDVKRRDQFTGVRRAERRDI